MSPDEVLQGPRSEIVHQLRRCGEVREVTEKEPRRSGPMLNGVLQLVVRPPVPLNLHPCSSNAEVTVDTHCDTCARLNRGSSSARRRRPLSVGMGVGVHKVYSTGSIVPMPRGRPSPKLAITVDPEVHGQVLAAAAARGVSISAWMTDAARRALRQQDGLAAVHEWERQFGALTEQETDDARGILQAAGTGRRTRARRAG